MIRNAHRRRFLICCGGVALGVGCVPRGAVAPSAPADAGTVPPPPPPMPPPSDATKDAGAGEPPDAGQTPPPEEMDAGTEIDAGEVEPPMDAGMPDSGECTEFVTMHDMYAQALYLDGTYGPLTGTIYVDYVLDGVPVELDFWHGHGGQDHKFTLLPEHFDALKRGERATITTTEVDSHQHTLFIDPVDPSYRVPGSADVDVPNC